MPASALAPASAEPFRASAPSRLQLGTGPVSVGSDESDLLERGRMLYGLADRLYWSTGCGQALRRISPSYRWPGEMMLVPFAKRDSRVRRDRVCR